MSVDQTYDLACMYSNLITWRIIESVNIPMIIPITTHLTHSCVWERLKTNLNEGFGNHLRSTSYCCEVFNLT